MLEPRIVAASIHGRDIGAHAGDRTAVVVNVSVHGCFLSIPMLTGQEWIPSSDSYPLRLDLQITASCSIVKASAELPVQQWTENFAAARRMFLPLM